MARGLYGMTEGNESRNQTEQFADRQSENRLVEGNWFTPMQKAAKAGDVKELGRLRDAMKATYVKFGVKPVLAQERADSTLRQAMNFLRF